MSEFRVQGSEFREVSSEGLMWVRSQKLGVRSQERYSMGTWARVRRTVSAYRGIGVSAKTIVIPEIA